MMGHGELQDVGSSHAGSERWTRADRAGALSARESLHVCMRACVPSCYRDASMCTFGTGFARADLGCTLDLRSDLRCFGHV